MSATLLITHTEAVSEPENITADIANISQTEAGQFLIVPLSAQTSDSNLRFYDTDGNAYVADSASLHDQYDILRHNGQTMLYASKVLTEADATDALLSIVANHVAGQSAERNTAIGAMKAHLSQVEVATLPHIADRGRDVRVRDDTCGFALAA